MKFQEITRLWLIYKSKVIKKTSLMRYEKIVSHYIVNKIGDKLMSELTLEDVLELINWLGELNLSQKTIQDIIVILKSILKYGKILGQEVIPIEAIPCPKIRQKEVEIFTFSDIASLKTFLERHTSPKNLGIYICIYTGIRLGELCALRWEDINLSERSIVINKILQRITVNKKSYIEIGQPKTPNSNRKVPISDELYELLSDETIDKKGYILTNKDKYLDPRTMQYYFKKILIQNNLKVHKFHALRHTFATQCVLCNVDIKSLSEILGHTSVNITLNKYVHSSFEVKKQQINLLSFNQ